MLTARLRHCRGGRTGHRALGHLLGRVKDAAVGELPRASGRSALHEADQRSTCGTAGSGRGRRRSRRRPDRLRHPGSARRSVGDGAGGSYDPSPRRARRTAALLPGRAPEPQLLAQGNTANRQCALTAPVRTIRARRDPGRCAAGAGGAHLCSSETKRAEGCASLRIRTRRLRTRTWAARRPRTIQTPGSRLRAVHRQRRSGDRWPAPSGRPGRGRARPPRPGPVPRRPASRRWPVPSSPARPKPARPGYGQPPPAARPPDGEQPARAVPAAPRPTASEALARARRRDAKWDV